MINIARESGRYRPGRELVEIQEGRIGGPEPVQLSSHDGHSRCDRGCYGEV